MADRLPAALVDPLVCIFVRALGEAIARAQPVRKRRRTRLPPPHSGAVPDAGGVDELVREGRGERGGGDGDGRALGRGMPDKEE